MRCLSFYHLRDIRRSWCLSSHVIWRVPCGDFEHQRRVQFQGCDAKRLQTHHAILFGSGWSCLFLPTVLQDALSEVIKVLPTHVVEGVCGRHHNFLGGGVHKEGRYHFWPRRLLARSFYHFWPRPLLAQTALWPFPACAKVGPEGWGPEGWGPEGWRPKFRAFFPSPATIFFLSSLSWRSFRGILAAVQGRGPPKVRVWVLWGHCASPDGPQARQRAKWVSQNDPRDPERALWVDLGFGS